MGLLSFLLNSLLNGSGLISDDKGCNWYCDNCGAFLNSQPGFTTSSDVWTCTKCGEENDVSEDNIIYDDDDDDFDDDDDEIPEGCRACGGPYPKCKDGCPAFDD